MNKIWETRIDAYVPFCGADGFEHVNAIDVTQVEHCVVCICLARHFDQNFI